MTLAHSRITAQGQISLPAVVRKKLGVGAGAVLEWTEQDGHIVVSKAGRYTSAEVHGALFGAGASIKSTTDVKQGLKRYMRKRHARG